MHKIEIPLDIPDINIENVEINKEGDIIITVKSTVKGTRCHKCGRKITKPHGHDQEITLRHLSILGRKVYIRIRPARYQCTYCKGNPITTQKLTWYEPRSPNTIAYEEHGEGVFVEYSQTIEENNPSGVFRPVRRLYQRGERGFRG